MNRQKRKSVRDKADELSKRRHHEGDTICKNIKIFFVFILRFFTFFKANIREAMIQLRDQEEHHRQHKAYLENKENLNKIKDEPDGTLTSRSEGTRGKIMIIGCNQQTTRYQSGDLVNVTLERIRLFIGPDQDHQFHEVEQQAGFGIRMNATSGPMIELTEEKNHLEI